MKKVSKTIGLVIVIFIFGSVTVFTALVVLASINAHRASTAEFENLRNLAAARASERGSEEEVEVVQFDALSAEMRAINPDYVGWLRIDGTYVDYPVVRGEDNKRYLNTSFTGERNPNGALFMDFRNLNITITPHLIIYGHNAPQGGLFSELHRFLDSDFLAENDMITLEVNGELLEFTIFDVRLTDVTDYAYHLDFSYSHAFNYFTDRIEAPMRALQIITLSTCTNCSNKDARLIVQGYR
ncbi:MAG: class B sortase [Defluviitaleaceae bacterium]|nr:class B sortase [Defluviitaleaceae bacterium]